MTNEEGIAYLQQHGWSKTSAEEEINKYLNAPELMRLTMPLDVHLRFLLAASPTRVVRIDKNECWKD